MELRKIIQMNVAKHILLDPPKGLSSYKVKYLRNVLKHAWWINSEFDLQARSRSKLTRLHKKVFKSETARVFIKGNTRRIHPHHYRMFWKPRNRILEESEDIDPIEFEKPLDRDELSAHIGLTGSALSNYITRHTKSWRLILFNDKIWPLNDFLYYLDQSGDPDEWSTDITNEEIISQLFKRFSILNPAQISFLTGIDFYDLGLPLSSLLKNNEIDEVIIGNERKVKYYESVEDGQVKIDWKNTEPFVLSRFDALVEIIKLEPQIVSNYSAYWLFIEGIPGLEFNLKKVSDKMYKLEKIHFLIKFDLEQIKTSLDIWSSNFDWAIDLESLGDESTVLPIELTKLLLDRGYDLLNGALSIEFRQNRRVSLSKLSSWEQLSDFNQKYFRAENALEILQDLIQVESLESLALRLRCAPQDVQLNKIYYTCGLGFKFGYVAESYLPLVFSAYPVEYQLNSKDNLILELLETSKTIQELSSISNTDLTEMGKQIKMMESRRVVMRNPDFAITGNLEYIRTDVVLPNLSDESHQLQNSAVNNLILVVLSGNIPLTIGQISKLLQLPELIIEDKLKILREKNLAKEGYFLDHVEDLQYSTEISLTNLINDVNETSVLEFGDESADEIGLTIKQEAFNFDMDQAILVPSSDPWTILHLNNIILDNRSLILNKKIPQGGDFISVVWNGVPVGYYIKYSSDLGLIDFDIELRIIPEYSSIHILSNIVEIIVSQNRTWYGDNLRLISINDHPIRSTKFEVMEFLLQSLGIDY